MAGAIHQLTKSVAHLNKVNGELIKEIHATQARCESMATANIELSNRVSELSQQLASRTWQGFNQSDTNAGMTCVIGSSIVRDVDPDKLVNTDVISISGGTIPMIHDTVNGLTNIYDRIILMVGGNDCDSHNNASRPVSDILEDYRLLIQDTKSKTDTVHVGSLCPRLKGQSVTDRIDSLNAGLQVMCNEEECTFINNDESFKLSNGAANDGYLLSDKVHLSFCGTNRLAKNLAQTIKQGHKDVCRRSNHRAKSNSSHQLPGQKREGQFAQGTQWRPHTQKPPFHQNGTHRHDQTDRRNIQPVGVHATRVQWQHSHQASSPWQADALSHDGDGWETVQPHKQVYTRATRDDRHHSSTNTDWRCGFCYERNHNRDTCRHGKPVKCDKCGSYGHKAKHHSHY